ncbi:hypothetical protein [Pseudacidovorax sp. RU35E]|uniref:hypothetical protein n=1 Tax=Pseudacidovorax sp. RU35E TaxID=1907403 RepID=UPI0009564B38|nr:hypothetical protein [Pseudacidovorax sp. RU35E]SIR20447.1 hypothetical protein SAMN05880557_108268 [Pseudacidovorax sp. RU35E]
MKKTLRHTGFALALATGALLGGPFAQASDSSSYTQERAMCGHIQQDRAACIREAGAAAQAARQGNLSSANANTYRQNALARCQLHQTRVDRAACEARVTGQGDTTIDGSVLGGGLIRETVTTLPPTSMPR